MNETEIRRLIETGRLGEAMRLLRTAEAGPGLETVWEVDERQVTALIAQRMAAWGADFARGVEQHVTTVLNKLRGRAD